MSLSPPWTHSMGRSVNGVRRPRPWSCEPPGVSLPTPIAPRARPMRAVLSPSQQDPQNFETEVSLSVMNSRRAGCPSRVARIPRSMAGTISPGSVTRSPKAPNARAIAA